MPSPARRPIPTGPDHRGPGAAGGGSARAFRGRAATDRDARARWTGARRSARRRARRAAPRVSALARRPVGAADQPQPRRAEAMTPSIDPRRVQALAALEKADEVRLPRA